MQFNSNPQTGGGSKNFLKLKDKQTVQGIFKGDVHEFHVKWKENKSHVCDENEPKAQFRFRINIVVFENGAFTPKIWEQGATVYNQLKELHSEYDLREVVIKITRNGEGRDTSYSILPLLKTQLTAAQKKQIDAVELLDLSNKEDTTEDFKPSSFDSDEAMPF